MEGESLGLVIEKGYIWEVGRYFWLVVISGVVDCWGRGYMTEWSDLREVIRRLYDDTGIKHWRS